MNLWCYTPQGKGWFYNELEFRGEIRPEVWTEGMLTFPDSTGSRVAGCSGREQKGTQDETLGHPYLKVEPRKRHQQRRAEWPVRKALTLC